MPIKFWYEITWTKIWFCLIFRNFALGFILSDYNKHETYSVYWRGLMINWGFNMREGDYFPHEFSLVTDYYTELQRIREYLPNAY